MSKKTKDEPVYRRLILPLHNGRTVELWHPIPFSEEDYELLKKFIEIFGSHLVAKDD